VEAGGGVEIASQICQKNGDLAGYYLKISACSFLKHQVKSLPGNTFYARKIPT
jgi:hypothetical protein